MGIENSGEKWIEVSTSKTLETRLCEHPLGPNQLYMFRNPVQPDNPENVVLDDRDRRMIDQLILDIFYKK